MWRTTSLLDHPCPAFDEIYVVPADLEKQILKAEKITGSGPHKTLLILILEKRAFQHCTTTEDVWPLLPSCGESGGRISSVPTYQCCMMGPRIQENFCRSTP